MLLTQHFYIYKKNLAIFNYVPCTHTQTHAHLIANDYLGQMNEWTPKEGGF